MTLDELIKKLQSFNCKALKDKEVAHFFNTELGYCYAEKVIDVTFDQENDCFLLFTEKEVGIRYHKDRQIKLKEKK